jgi:hypothetical protein
VEFAIGVPRTLVNNEHAHSHQSNLVLESRRSLLGAQ